MSRDLSSLESRFDGLLRLVRRLESRITALEEGRDFQDDREWARDQAAAGESDASAEGGSATETGQGRLVLIGQTILILGGAFLLRWMTDTGTLPHSGGTALGLAYAGVWIAVADRSASHGNRVAPSFRGLAAVLIGFPLVWESTTEFGFLTPTVAAAVLATMIGCCLFVAWRWKIRSLAWALLIGAVPTTIGLAFSTRLFLPFIGLLLLLGLATVWLGYLRRWVTLGWVTALVLNFTLGLITVSRLVNPESYLAAGIGPGTLIFLLISLLVVYFGSFVARTLLRGRDATMLEIGQAITVFAIGLGGSFATGRAAGSMEMPLGVTTLALAAGCYAAAFAFIDRRRGRGRNFIFYSSLGLALFLTASFLLLHGRTEVIVLSMIAVLAAIGGGRWRRATLSLHGAVYVVAAAFTAGVFSFASDAFFGADLGRVRDVSIGLLVTTFASAVCVATPVNSEGSPWGRFSAVTKVADLVVLLAGLCGLALAFLAGWLPTEAPDSTSSGVAAPLVHRGALATARTGVLAVSAVGLAAISSWERVRVATWFVYPLLLFGGIKLIFEDFRCGGSFLLFASLSMFGLAVIIAPRWIGNSTKSRAERVPVDELESV